MARAYFRYKTGRAGAKKVAPDNGTWWLDYQDAAGRRRQERCPALTRQEAERLAHEAAEKAFRIRKGLTVAGPAPITWAEATQKYRAARKGLASFRSVEAQLRLHLDPLFGHRLLSDITPADVEALEARYRDTLHLSTIRALQIRVAAVYTWATRKARLYTGFNPGREAAKVEAQPRAPKALTHEQVEQLLAHAEDFAFVILFAVLTGLRKGEVAGLRWDCVDLEKGLLYVRYSYGEERTKTRRARAVPIHADLLPALRALRARSKSRWVFHTARGGMHTKNWDTDGLFRAALRKAGLVSGYELKCRRKGCGYLGESKVKHAPPCPRCGFRLWPVGVPLAFSFKDLRSTFGTWVAESGGIRVAQLLLGHSTVETTETHYAAVRVPALRTGLEGLRLGAARRDKDGTSGADSGAAGAAGGKKGA